MTVRRKVGMCIARYGKIAEKESKVRFEWWKMKKNNFNFLAKAFYLTMLKYDNLGEERLDNIKDCFKVDFCDEKGELYFIVFMPDENTDWMIHPFFLQLHYLANMLYRKYYSKCEDFFYISELYYKHTKGKVPERSEFMEGKEKCKRFDESEFANFLKVYESHFTLSGREELHTLFQNICISIFNMEHVYFNSDSYFHSGAY